MVKISCVVILWFGLVVTDTLGYPQDFKGEVELAILNGMGMAKEALDNGASMKHSGLSEMNVGGAKASAGHNVGVGFGDSMNTDDSSDNDRRRRKRSVIGNERAPCRKGATTTAPPAERRRRQAADEFEIEGADNDVLPQYSSAEGKKLSQRFSEVWSNMMDRFNQAIQQLKETFGGDNPAATQPQP